MRPEDGSAPHARDGGLTYGCRGDMEMVAYEAQRAFLSSMNIDLFDVMAITPMGFKLLTLCHIEGY